MKARRFGISAAVALLLATALARDAGAAVPAPLTHEGRLLDASGQPVTTSQVFTYKIYDAASAGNVLWTEVLTVPLDQGYFAVQLGLTSAIPDALLVGGPRFLGIQVGSDAEMVPREQLASVPYARVAGEVSGDIHPTSVVIGTKPVISADGKWVGPAPMAIGACQAVDGPCGAGTYNQSTSFLDRVGGNCPADHPVFNGFRFFRCGTLGTATEGLAIHMTCCALQPN